MHKTEPIGSLHRNRRAAEMEPNKVSSSKRHSHKAADEAGDRMLSAGARNLGKAHAFSVTLRRLNRPSCGTRGRQLFGMLLLFVIHLYLSPPDPVSQAANGLGGPVFKSVYGVVGSSASGTSTPTSEQHSSQGYRSTNTSTEPGNFTSATLPPSWLQSAKQGVPERKRTSSFRPPPLEGGNSQPKRTREVAEPPSNSAGVAKSSPEGRRGEAQDRNGTAYVRSSFLDFHCAQKGNDDRIVTKKVWTPPIIPGVSQVDPLYAAGGTQLFIPEASGKNTPVDFSRRGNAAVESSPDDNKDARTSNKCQECDSKAACISEASQRHGSGKPLGSPEASSPVDAPPCEYHCGMHLGLVKQQHIPAAVPEGSGDQEKPKIQTDRHGASDPGTNVVIENVHSPDMTHQPSNQGTPCSAQQAGISQSMHATGGYSAIPHAGGRTAQATTTAGYPTSSSTGRTESRAFTPVPKRLKGKIPRGNAHREGDRERLGKTSRAKRTTGSSSWSATRHCTPTSLRWMARALRAIRAELVCIKRMLRNRRALDTLPPQATNHAQSTCHASIAQSARSSRQEGLLPTASPRAFGPPGSPLDLSVSSFREQTSTYGPRASPYQWTTSRQSLARMSGGNFSVKIPSELSAFRPVVPRRAQLRARLATQHAAPEGSTTLLRSTVLRMYDQNPFSETGESRTPLLHSPTSDTSNICLPSHNTTRPVIGNIHNAAAAGGAADAFQSPPGGENLVDSAVSTTPRSRSRAAVIDPDSSTPSLSTDTDRDGVQHSDSAGDTSDPRRRESAVARRLEYGGGVRTIEPFLLNRLRGFLADSHSWVTTAEP